MKSKTQRNKHKTKMDLLFKKIYYEKRLQLEKIGATKGEARYLAEKIAKRKIGGVKRK